MKRALILLAACGGSPRHTAPPPPEPAKTPAIVEWTDLNGSIRAVEVTGADATSAKEIQAALAGEVGKQIDRRRLRATLDKISDEHHSADVVARGIQLDEGVKLVVELVPNPLVHALVAHEAGKDIATPAELVAAVGLPLDPATLDHVSDRLRDRYQERGFIEADVKWTKQKAGDKVDVAIEITPGRQVMISGIELRGNKKVKKDDLVKEIAGDFPPQTPWQPDKIERAVLAITDEYYNRGFINATVTAEPPAGDSTPAAFTIVEGDQYKIGSIVVTGVPAADKKKYATALTVKKGDVFNRKAVMGAMKKVEDTAKTAGLANAGVTPIVSTDAKKKTVEIVLEISH